MCQIIYTKGKLSQIISFLIKYKEEIKYNLDLKGGDLYSLTLVFDNNYLVSKDKDYYRAFNNFFEKNNKVK